MPNHAHAVIGRIDRDIRRAVGHIKSEGTRLLRAAGYFADLPRSPWADHGWNVYLDSPEDMTRAIAYVERNPLRNGLPAQSWTCVRPWTPRT